MTVTRPAPSTGRVTWDWARPRLFGIVNVTPDSFSRGGRFVETEAAVRHGLALLKAGADAVDVGGESTRPGATPLSVDEELARVIPVIAGLRRAAPGAILSIDTVKSQVAEAAFEAGASVLNDPGVGEPAGPMARVAARFEGLYVAMHARGTPLTMDALTDYPEGVVSAVRAALAEKAAMALSAGVPRENVLLDPGVGFAKTAAQSLSLLASIDAIGALGHGLLVGASRKRVLVAPEAHPRGWALDTSGPDARLGASVAVVVAMVLRGVSALRVHDVAESVQAARMAHALAVAGGGARC